MEAFRSAGSAGLARLDKVADDDLSRLERLTASVIIAMSLALHALFFLRAGPLWRDEASTLNVAAMPSWARLWGCLELDPLSGLYAPLLRLWGGIAGFSDRSVRAMGAISGLILLACLWTTARKLCRGIPLISLALLSLSPLLIRGGDSIRPYGLGLALLLAAALCIWRHIEAPSPRRWAAAAIAAILSVQILYHNAFFILAILAGPIVFFRIEGRRALSLQLTAIGAAAALSLSPYLGLIQRSAQWHVIIQYPLSGARILAAAARGMAMAGPAAALGWLGALSLCAVFFWRSRKDLFRDFDGASFALLAAGCGLAANLVFLSVQRFFPQPRYFLGFFALAAVAADAAYLRWAGGKRLRAARLAAAALIAAASWPAAASQVSMRQTNIDIVARRLDAAAREDLVVVNPWFFDISFGRYYRGAAPWVTLPPLEDAANNRVDLVKEAMTRTDDPLAPLLSRIAETLKGGHRVWLVGTLPIIRNGQIPRSPAPPPLPETGWNSVPYLLAWADQAGYFVQTHAKSGDFPNVLPEGLVNPDERVRLEVVYGWRDAKKADADPKAVP